MISVDGGIGANLTSSNGISLSFIAQQKAGKVISGAGLTTSGRVKVQIDGKGEKFEVLE
ncbi:hypothetical protein D3C85_1838230 [compost metagenome]